MARIDALTHSIAIAGEMPMLLLAHYYADVERGEEGDPVYLIHLGFIEVFISGKHVADLEGGQIPADMAKRVMQAIPEIPRRDLLDALEDEAEADVFAREHAVGRL